WRWAARKIAFASPAVMQRGHAAMIDERALRRQIAQHMAGHPDRAAADAMLILNHHVKRRWLEHKAAVYTLKRELILYLLCGGHCASSAATARVQRCAYCRGEGCAHCTRGEVRNTLIQFSLAV